MAHCLPHGSCVSVTCVMNALMPFLDLSTVTAACDSCSFTQLCKHSQASMTRMQGRELCQLAVSLTAASALALASGAPAPRIACTAPMRARGSVPARKPAFAAADEGLGLHGSVCSCQRCTLEDEAIPVSASSQAEMKGAQTCGTLGPTLVLHSDADRREFISAGAAAGLAVCPEAFRPRKLAFQVYCYTCAAGCVLKLACRLQLPCHP